MRQEQGKEAAGTMEESGLGASATVTGILVNLCISVTIYSDSRMSSKRFFT